MAPSAVEALASLLSEEPAHLTSSKTAGTSPGLMCLQSLLLLDNIPASEGFQEASSPSSQHKTPLDRRPLLSSPPLTPMIHPKNKASLSATAPFPDSQPQEALNLCLSSDLLVPLLSDSHFLQSLSTHTLLDLFRALDSSMSSHPFLLNPPPSPSKEESTPGLLTTMASLPSPSPTHTPSSLNTPPTPPLLPLAPNTCSPHHSTSQGSAQHSLHSIPWPCSPKPAPTTSSPAGEWSFLLQCALSPQTPPLPSPSEDTDTSLTDHLLREPKEASGQAPWWRGNCTQDAHRTPTHGTLPSPAKRQRCEHGAWDTGSMEVEDGPEAEGSEKLPSPHKSRKLRGVRQRKWGTWAAEIREPKKPKKIWLGTYPSEEEAGRAFDIAARLLHGPSAFLNFPDDLALMHFPASVARALVSAAQDTPMPCQDSFLLHMLLSHLKEQERRGLVEEGQARKGPRKNSNAHQE